MEGGVSRATSVLARGDDSSFDRHVMETESIGPIIKMLTRHHDAFEDKETSR